MLNKVKVVILITIDKFKTGMEILKNLLTYLFKGLKKREVYLHVFDSELTF